MLDPDTLPSYLRSKITVGACWIWTGARQSNGYGSVGIPNGHRTVLAHRHVYELLVGPIADGLQIDHLCRTRSCVNPAHLEPVTQSVNQRRGFAARGPVTTCKRDHDTTAPDSRDRTGYCRECKNERQRELYRAKQAA